MRIGFVSGGKQFFEVPKRWFQHLYLIGIVSTGTLLFLCWRKVVITNAWPKMLGDLLRLLQLPCPLSFSSNTDAIPVLLVLTLELVQVCRRCYETFFVNIFSTTASMTLLHYILGIIFYLSFGLCVVTGTNFDKLQLPDTIPVSHCLVYVVSVVIFLAATALQHQSFRILAGLRTDKKVPEEAGYLLPHGGLFNIVACPHFLAEVTIYFSFCCVYGLVGNPVLLSMFVFVLVNQTIAAKMTYQWYCRNFPGYERDKYAIFPFIV